MNDTPLAPAPTGQTAIGAALQPQSRAPFLMYGLTVGLFTLLLFSYTTARGSGGTGSLRDALASAYPSSEEASYAFGDDHWSDADTAHWVVSRWLSDSPNRSTITISRQNAIWVRELLASAARQAKANHANRRKPETTLPGKGDAVAQTISSSM